MEKQIKGNIVDIYSRRIYPGVVHIEDEKILYIEECRDEKFECYILPGFIDAHVHIESSMLIPSEFSKLGLIIYTAKYLSHNNKNIKDIKKGLLPLFLIILLLP